MSEAKKASKYTLSDRNKWSSKPVTSIANESSNFTRVQKLLAELDVSRERRKMLNLQMQQKTDEMNRTHANADKIKARVSREMYESMIKNHQYNHDYPLTDDVKERYRLRANTMGNEAAIKYLKGEYRGPYWGV